MASQITISNNKAFVDDFMKYYLQNRFGTMNKTELEELLVFLLSKHGNVGELSNFNASIALHIPESKVRSLLYRAELKYKEYDDEEVIDEFFKLLQNRRFEIYDGRFIITIENQYLRQAIASKVKTTGKNADGSFNREILTLTNDGFYSLIENFYTKNKQKEIISNYKKVKKDVEKNISFKEMLQHFLNGAAEEAGAISVESVVNLATGGTVGIAGIGRIVHKLTKK